MLTECDELIGFLSNQTNQLILTDPRNVCHDEGERSELGLEDYCEFDKPVTSLRFRDGHSGAGLLLAVPDDAHIPVYAKRDEAGALLSVEILFDRHDPRYAEWLDMLESRRTSDAQR